MQVFFLFLNVTKSPLCRLVNFNVTFVLICAGAGVYDKPTSPSPPSPSPLSLSPHIKNWMLGHVSSFFASRDFEIRVTKWISVLTITCLYHFIVLQRQILRAVPVSEVFYEWKETSSRYWVFGLDHQVYAPDYPQKCCCGCSILWRWRDLRDVRDILQLSCHLA